MRTGDRRPTLADVAAEAGVSTALVSIVMRDAPGASADTRRRVLQVAERLGYQPDSRARLLRSGRSRLLGVVFGVEHAFHGDLVTGLYDAADKVGYELTLSATTPHRDEHRAIASLLQDRCEALILLGPQSRISALAGLAARMPVVSLMRAVRDPAVDVVRTDDGLGLGEAVDHLVALGHRRIAHIDGGRIPGSAERRRGYRDAMRRHGLDAEIRVVAGGSSDQDGARATAALLAAAPPAITAPNGCRAADAPTGRGATDAPNGCRAADAPTASGGRGAPTAITAFNDRSAAGALDALRRAGLSVPGDVSVVGFDDSSIAGLAHLDLTTIAQDTTALATLAVGRAVDRIETGPISDRELVIAPHLVVRGTTGPVED